MICNSCKNEFSNINGLKFCPYCGASIDESMPLNAEKSPDEVHDQEKEYINQGEIKDKKKYDTLKMPAITEEDIKNYNRDKFFSALKKVFIQKKVTIPIVTVLVIMVIGVFGYKFLFAKLVDEVRIKEDLVGKIVTLAKGTNIEIKKDYLKYLSINSRTTNKNEGRDEIKVAVTLNNGTVEVKTLLSLLYTYEGKNQWKISDKIGLAGDAVVKPVMVMDEKQFMDGLKKLNITIADTVIPLNGGDVKSLGMVSRNPDLDNDNEEVLVEVAIDSGLLSSTGKIKCKLAFENELWGIASVERNNTDDFILGLSPSLSQEKIIEAIRKAGLEETVTHPNLFGGKSFNVKDSFTKSINIADKKYDGQNGVLQVTAKRENVAGQLKSTLTTGYTFNISLSKFDLSNKSKTTVSNVTIDNMSKEVISSTITGVDIEGGNVFFWLVDKHKITAEEAKTFKLDEILWKKNLLNIKYVYGSVTYKDGNKDKTTQLVAFYFLVYDSSKGYNWKLDRIVGEDSPNYKTYNKALINQ